MPIPEDTLQLSEGVIDRVCFLLYDGPLELSGSERLANKSNRLFNVIDELETIRTYL